MSATDKSVTAAPHPVYSEDEIDLRQLVRAVWRYRWIVVFLGFFGGFAGIGISLLTTKYVAEGLFLTPGMQLSDFKQYEVALGNEQRLRDYIALNGLEGTQTETMLERLVVAPGALGQAVQPVFAMTGKEARAYDIRVPDGGGLLGIQLSLARKERSKESPIRHLAGYVRHTMIDVDLRDTMLNQCLTYQNREVDLRNEQIQSEFANAQNETRATTLRELIKTIPGADRVGDRQQVALRAGLERYLAPTAQLVAVEIQIAEAALAEQRRERDRQAVALKKAYYCKAREAQEAPHTGQQFLEQLAEIRSELLAGQDMTSPVVEQVANELDVERKSLRNKYLERSRFVVAPDGGEQKRRKPGLILGGLLGGVLGGGFGLFLALVLAWWHDNRLDVLSADED